MKRTALILALVLAAPSLLAQERTYSDADLDTLVIARQRRINPYWLVGAQYGYSLQDTYFNPSRETDWTGEPLSFGVTLTRHQPMEGIFGAAADAIARAGLVPYFAIQGGFLYTHESFRFKANRETGVTPTLDGATGTRLEAFEVPLTMQWWFDGGAFKLLFPELGLYAGYRGGIERFGDNVAEAYRTAYRPTDHRWEYGVKAGLGVGLAFDPIEVHLRGTFRMALRSLYQPDSYSPYYYRFAYPYDILISVGIHYQLSNRQGRTRRELREEARRQVYDEPLTPSL